MTGFVRDARLELTDLVFGPPFALAHWVHKAHLQIPGRMSGFVWDTSMVLKERRIPPAEAFQYRRS